MNIAPTAGAKPVLQEVDRPLTALSGHRAAHVLAALGLVSLLPGGRLRFEGSAGTPVLTHAATPQELVETAAEALVARTWHLGRSALHGVGTTTPRRTVVNPLVDDAWDTALETGTLAVTGALQTLDVAATTTARPDREPDLQVPSATLTLLSGKSYTAKSVEDTWHMLMVVDRVDACAVVRDQLADLLCGRVAVVQAKPTLRFSANQVTPRTTSGAETCDVHPLIDLLAFTGQTLLQPDQREVPARGARPAKALTWVLNPVPLSLEAILELHEAPPSRLGWPRWTSLLERPGGSTSVTYLAPARPTAPESGGSHD